MSHHSVWARQWPVEAAVVCWGQVCGAVKLEQYPCTGGPDPYQARNVKEEALGTMCSVPMPFWVPPASASFCFQARENRKTGGLGPRSQSLFCNQLGGLESTLSPLSPLQLFWSLWECTTLSCFIHHWMSVNSPKSISGKMNMKTMLHCPLMVQIATTLSRQSCAGLTV